MAEAILLTGKRGEGKTKAAVRMIRDYLRQGRVVATNLDLNMEHLLGPTIEWKVKRQVSGHEALGNVFRLPDVPSIEHLEALPLGNAIPTEEHKNGVLVLDEVAVFLNSRTWNDKQRSKFIAWLAHSRKDGWDLVFIAQHARMVDAQIRESLFELWGICKRMDKMAVPLISPVYQWITGRPLRFPAVHVVTLRYGFAPGAPKALGWMFGGSEFHRAYDTLQKINPDGDHQGLATMLSPWHLKGRYMTKLQLIRGAAIASMLVGMAIGAAGHWLWASRSPEKIESKPERVSDIGVIGITEANGQSRIALKDGRVLDVSAAKLEGDTVIYKSGNEWFRGRR